MAGEPILIVDDNAQNLKLAQIVLGEEGYDVHTAVDAERALVMLRDLEPRMILLDIRLPGMSGLDLARLIRKDPARKHIIILAISASALQQDVANALAAGCNGYLTKPIDIDVLIKTVAESIAS